MRAAPAQFTEPPVIIGGCARSGTTLLISILSCHPAIYAIPQETQLLCLGAFDSRPCCRGTNLPALYDILAAANVNGAHRRWCEKTPRNAMCFANIRAALPEARLVNLVRDGRDVCTSRHPGNPTDYWVPPGRWMRETSAALAVDSAYTIRYEDIVQDFAAALLELLIWIGEPWNEALADYPHSAEIRESRAWAHPAIPLHDAGIGRWRDPAHADQIEFFYSQEGTREMLETLGYPCT